MRPPLFGTHCLGKMSYGETVQAVNRAAEQGYDFLTWWDQANGWVPRSIWTPDLSPAAEAVPSLDWFFDPTAVIASAAQAGPPDIGFVNGPFDVVRRGPQPLAQMMLTLDHVTKGRTITVLASGEVKQMKPYGYSRVGSADKLWDSVHIIKKLCTETERFSYEGRVWKLDRALMALEPYGEMPPPLWVAGGGEECMYLASTVADGWVTYGASAVEHDPEVLRHQVEHLHELIREAKRDIDDVAVSLMLIALIHEDPKVLDELRDQPHIRWMSQMVMPNSNFYKTWGLPPHPMGDNWSYAAKLVNHWIGREEALDIIHRTPREAVDKVFYVGTPEQVTEELSQYIDTGVTHLLLVNGAGLAGVEDQAPQVIQALRARYGDRLAVS